MGGFSGQLLTVWLWLSHCVSCYDVEQAGSKERLVPRSGGDFGARVRPSACACVGLSVYMWVCMCASELAGIRVLSIIILYD